ALPLLSPCDLALHDALPISLPSAEEPSCRNCPKSKPSCATCDLCSSADRSSRSPSARKRCAASGRARGQRICCGSACKQFSGARSEEHTSELQSRVDIVCRL